MSFISATILLFLVMDPFGNVPVFLCMLRGIPAERKQRIIIREMLISLAVLIIFLIAGPLLLDILQISEASLQIAGGIILFMIAIKMIFGEPEYIFGGSSTEEPLIVPLAIPCIAGPSAIATVMLLMGQSPDRWLDWLLAVFLAWMVSSIILISSSKLDRILGKKGLNALQHLMGLILTAISVEMFLEGLKIILSSSFN
ncbi:MAG: MarC family protein [Desulfurivibrionaceae bacterium]